MYFVYALYNKQRNKIYIGQSNNPGTRIKRHNRELPTKLRSYTNLNSGIWVIVYSEKYNTRHEALKRERQLKSQKGREFVWNIVRNRNY